MTEPNADSPNDAASDAPDVLTFPPVIFAAFFIIGYVTDRAFPSGIGLSSIRYGVGGVLIGLSIVLAGWALAHFARAKTHVDVRKPATSLVTGGPYRLSRNPMYLALSLLYAGFCVALLLPLTLALLLPCLVVLYRGVIRREEAYLDRKFGEAYRNYRSRVRRWL